MGRWFALVLVAGCADPPDHIPIVLDKPTYVVGDEIDFTVDDACLPVVNPNDCWSRWSATGADGAVVQFDGLLAATPGVGSIEVTARWFDGIDGEDVVDSIAVTVVAP